VSRRVAIRRRKRSAAPVREKIAPLARNYAILGE
jgi:hypothetical protein